MWKSQHNFIYILKITVNIIKEHSKVKKSPKPPKKLDRVHATQAPTPIRLFLEIHHWHGQNTQIVMTNIGVNIIAFGRKLKHFSALPLFTSNVLLFCVFRIGKNALYTVCSASSGPQTTRQPASSVRQSIIRSAKLCVLCLFVKLRPGHVGPGIKKSWVIVGLPWAKSV